MTFKILNISRKFKINLIIFKIDLYYIKNIQKIKNKIKILRMHI